MGREMDVLVIGGGPAGLAAAIAARNKGFEVTVADSAKPPIDKACGEGLMPGTVSALGELGIKIHADDGRMYRGIRFLDGTTLAETSFLDAPGIGVRRTVLHQKMVERAEECGISLMWNTLVTGLTPNGAMVGGSELTAKWVIGADGIRSRVRRWCGLDPISQEAVRFGQRRHYRVKPWTDYMEIHWGRRMQAYVTPIGNEETCVVLIADNSRTRFEEVGREFPRLASSLESGELSSAERGAVTEMRSLKQVYQGNVALIGDASGSVDAITGEGLCLGFRQAMALAEALEAEDLEIYQKEHRRLARRPKVMGRLLLLLGRSTAVRRRLLKALASDPELFARLLAVHAGESSPRQFATTSMRLGWQFLTA
jgi:menaquinone-9 beta-reductase